MADFSFLSQGVNPVQIPNPVDQYKALMTLKQLANTTAMQNFTMAQAQRKDAAAREIGSILPQIPGDVSDEQLNGLLQNVSPDARQGVLDYVQAKRKQAAEIEAQKSKSALENTDAKTKQLTALANIAADPGADGPTKVMRLVSAAKFYGINLPPPTEDLSLPGAVDRYTQGIASQAVTAAQRMEDATKRRGQDLVASSATEGHRVTERGQNIGAAEKNAQLAVEQTKEDPLGIFGSRVPPVSVPPSVVGGQPAQGSAPMPTAAAPAGTPPQGDHLNLDAAGMTPQNLAAIAADIAKTKGIPLDQAMQLVQQMPNQQQGQPTQAGQIDLGNAGDLIRSGVSGPELLKALPPATGNMVQAMIEGREPFPGAFAMRSGAIRGLMQLATLVEPGFDATKYQARVKMAQSLAAGTPGSLGVTADQANKIVNHIGELNDKFAALGNFNSGIPGNNAANYVANTIQQSRGDPRMQGAMTAAQGVADELSKFFRQSNTSDTSVKHWLDTLPLNGSPAQQQEALMTLIDLMQGQVSPIEARIADTMGKPRSLLKPDAQAVIERLRNQKVPTKAAAPSSQFTATDPTGKVHTFPSEAAARAAQFEFDKYK